MNVDIDVDIHINLDAAIDIYSNINIDINKYGCGLRCRSMYTVPIDVCMYACMHACMHACTYRPTSRFGGRSPLLRLLHFAGFRDKEDQPCSRNKCFYSRAFGFCGGFVIPRGLGILVPKKRKSR